MDINIGSNYNPSSIVRKKGLSYRPIKRRVKIIECILAANHLVLVVLASQSHKRRLNDATTKPEDKVKSRFLLNVVIGQGPSIFELLPSENQTLLIRRNT